MDLTKVEEHEYEVKCRRDSRKLVDKLHKAHKRHMLREAGVTDNLKLPIIKIDISPVAPSDTVLDIPGLPVQLQRFLVQGNSLPHNTPLTSVGGLISYYKLGENAAFDLVYVGENGHIGLRSEKAFSLRPETREFNPESLPPRTMDMLALATRIYENASYDGPAVVSVELDGVMDWTVKLGNFDERGLCVLPKYSSEIEHESLPHPTDVSIQNIVFKLTGNILRQLAIHPSF